MLVNNILDASNKEDDIVDVDATAKKDLELRGKLVVGKRSKRLRGIEEYVAVMALV